jgi:hypothetical protein
MKKYLLSIGVWAVVCSATGFAQSTRPAAPAAPSAAEGAATRQFEAAIEAARNARDEQVRAADATFKAAGQEALRKVQEQRRPAFDAAIAAYDARIREVTKTGDLDRALAIRGEKQAFIAREAETDKQLLKQWDDLVAETQSGVRPKAVANSPAATTRPPLRASRTLAARDLTELLPRRVATVGTTPEAWTGPAQVNGDVAWTENPHGWSLAGKTVQIGNSVSNHGGTSFAGRVIAEPGFCLTGGTLRISAGTIEFHGTPEKPLLLKNVQIECEFTGAVKAENTIFDGCILKKAGGSFSNDGYSSKWELTGCVLYRSGFPYLGRMDYGIKFRACDFYECVLPQRHWGYQNREKPGDDGPAVVRNEWSTVDDCSFYRCKIAASVIWASTQCDFAQCEVPEAEDFASRTDLDVDLGAPKGDPLLKELAVRTNHSGQGAVRFLPRVISGGPPPRSPVWGWVQGSTGPSVGHGAAPARQQP